MKSKTKLQSKTKERRKTGKQSTLVKTAAAALSAVLLSAALLAGCGSGSGNGGNTGNMGNTDDPGNSGNGSQSATAKYQALMVNEAAHAMPVGGGITADEWAGSDERWAWQKEREELIASGESVQDTLYPFYKKTVAAFLEDDGQSNSVYSPVNVYVALSMLAECAGGESRRQILDLLGTDDLGKLRETVNAVWLANEAETPIVTTSLANSIWMDQAVDFNEEVTKTLADSYHASSFSGELADAETNAALREWINDNTGGLLKSQTNDVEMTDDTMIALASTLYLKAAWGQAFDPDSTSKGTFYGADGGQSVDMMHQTLDGSVYYGSGFKALAMEMEDCGSMFIFLPDEGITAGSLTSNEDVYQILRDRDGWRSAESGDVKLTLPKFDVSSSMQLIEKLEALGVTDIFGGSADISPLSPEAGGYVSDILHAARVKADEEGVEAAAFTVSMVDTTALVEPQIIDFTVDRPFMFVMVGEDGTFLFTGIVNRPQ